MTLRKLCARGADAFPRGLSSISHRPAQKHRPAPSPLAIGKRWSAQVQFRCHPAAEGVSDLAAVWSKKVKSRSARPIAISKDGWAIARLLFIWHHPQSSRRAHWLDSFARRRISLSAPQALPLAALRKNRD